MGKEAKQLCYRLAFPNPRQRVSATDALRDPWFRHVLAGSSDDAASKPELTVAADAVISRSWRGNVPPLRASSQPPVEGDRSAHRRSSPQRPMERRHTVALPTSQRPPQLVAQLQPPKAEEARKLSPLRIRSGQPRSVELCTLFAVEAPFLAQIADMFTGVANKLE